MVIARWGRSRRDWLGRFLDLSSSLSSHDRFDAIHRVSAGAAANPISLGHVVTDVKSNETTARIGIKNKRLTTG